MYSRTHKGKGNSWKPGNVGVMPCVSCPVGTYQPNKGSITCLNCENNLTTTSKGSISSNKCVMLFSSEELHCKNITCHNKGVCKIYNGHVWCSCLQDYFGKFLSVLFFVLPWLFKFIN